MATASSFILYIAVACAALNYFAPAFVPTAFSALVENAPVLAICAWFTGSAAKGMSSSGAFEVVIDEPNGATLFSKLREKRVPEMADIVRALADNQ